MYKGIGSIGRFVSGFENSKALKGLPVIVFEGSTGCVIPRGESGDIKLQALIAEINADLVSASARLKKTSRTVSVSGGRLT